MRFAGSGRADQDGAAIPGDEVAVEQADDGGFGNAFGEVEVVVGQGFLLGEPRLVQAPFQGALLADGLFHADERGQHLQHGRAFAGGFVEHFAIALGDFQELQVGQVALQLCGQRVVSCGPWSFSSVWWQKRS